MPDETEPSITELVDEFLAEQRAAAAVDDGSMTFTKSVQAFIAASDWLAAEHMPAIYSLTALAKQLDGELTAALAGQFGVTFRDLRAQAPRAADPEDPIEKALRDRAGAGSGEAVSS
jgi:hypothetical protein